MYIYINMYTTVVLNSNVCVYCRFSVQGVPGRNEDLHEETASYNWRMLLLYNWSLS